MPIVFTDRVAGASKLSRRMMVEGMVLVWQLRFGRVPTDGHVALPTPARSGPVLTAALPGVTAGERGALSWVGYGTRGATTRHPFPKTAALSFCEGPL